MRRVRVPTAKPGELKAAWGRPDRGERPDVVYAWGVGACSPDARVLAAAFEDAEVFDGKTLRQVLIDRGYDITTLRFSVQRSAQ